MSAVAAATRGRVGWGLRLGMLLLGLAVSGAMVAWWLHTHERVDREVDLPARGEAAYNPLYLLREALRADGVPAQSRQRLQLQEIVPAQRDTLVILSDTRGLSIADVDGLLDWVDAGGHLLVTTPRVSGRFGVPREWELLQRLGVALYEGTAGCLSYRMPGEEAHVEFCGATRFSLPDDEPGIAWGDFADGFVLARLQRGKGTVDVVASMDFMLNDSLNEAPHAALARQLLAPNYGQGTVHLVYATRMPPLWRLLLERAWMVWLPLLLALVAWLWMRMQRFGPLQPTPALARRALLEHVQASGEHLYRYGQAGHLHAAARDAFLQRLRRRDPVAASLEGEAQAETIAALLGTLSARDVLHALRSPRPHDAADFRLRIARLIEMRNRL